MHAYPNKRKKPPTINRWYLLWYLSVRDKWLYGGLIVSIISLLLLVVRLPYYGLPPYLLVSSLIIGLLITANTIRRIRGELRDSGHFPKPLTASEFEDFLTSVELPEELRNSGYEVLVGGIAKNIFDDITFRAASAASPRLNRLLWKMSLQPLPSFITTVPSGSRTTLLRRYKTWKLPTISRKLLFPTTRALSRHSSLANEDKIRLCEDIHPLEPLGPLTIERTNYLSDIVTGQLTGVRFLDRQGFPFYNGFDLPYKLEASRWTLKTCQEAACSNQLGVSSLVVAVSQLERTDPPVLQGHVFIVVQAPGNIQSPGLLAPSGSGSLDWSDYIDFGDEFVSKGMIRELLEETSKGDWKRLLDRGRTRVFLTGFGRMLHRGGKPEFFGLVVMPRKSDERGIDPSEKEFVAGFETIVVRPLSAQSLCAALQRYAAANENRLSHPLFECMRFAEDFLQAQESQFDSVLAHVGEY